MNVEEEGNFEVVGLAPKIQPGLASSSNGQLFTISFIPGDPRIPKGVGTLSKTLALLPSKNGSQPVAVLGEVDMSVFKEAACARCSFNSKRLVCISLSFGVASWKCGGPRSWQRKR